MGRTILVPLDGSRFGERALPLAVQVARQTGAGIQLVHVHVPLALRSGHAALGDGAAFDSEAQAAAQTYLKGVAERIQEVAGVPAAGQLLDGPVAEAVHEQAVVTGAELVVMTTHGRGALARLWLGSVADELVRHLSGLVLLVRPHEEGPEGIGDHPLRNVLIPLDGSALAEDILAPALALAPEAGTEFTLLRVVGPPMPPGFEPSFTPSGAEEAMLCERLRTLQQEVEKEAAAYLDRVAGRLAAQGRVVRTRVVSHAQPAQAILDEAQKGGADLIALATHGRRGLARLFLGSVADKVLRGASVPVLMHRASETPSPKGVQNADQPIEGRNGAANPPVDGRGDAESGLSELHPGCRHDCGRPAGPH